MVTWDHRLSFLFEDFCSQKNWLEGAQSAPETVLLSFLKTCSLDFPKVLSIARFDSKLRQSG